MIPCKRCMLSEIDPDGLYREVSELIALIRPDERTEDGEYRRRLGICSECDSLNTGTCGVCGCFAELRAAKKAMHCPHEMHKW